MINIVKSKDDRRRIMQLLQFAEPIEKSKVVFLTGDQNLIMYPRREIQDSPIPYFAAKKKIILKILEVQVQIK